MTWDFLPVHNACLCVPLPTKWPSRWATERLLSKTLCYDHPEPNNNSRKASVQVKASQVAVASASSVTSKLVPGQCEAGIAYKSSEFCTRCCCKSCASLQTLAVVWWHHPYFTFYLSHLTAAHCLSFLSFAAVAIFLFSVL